MSRPTRRERQGRIAFEALQKIAAFKYGVGVDVARAALLQIAALTPFSAGKRCEKCDGKALLGGAFAFCIACRGSGRKPQPPPPKSECANRCQTLPDGDYHHAPDCPKNPRGGEGSR